MTVRFVHVVPNDQRSSGYLFKEITDQVPVESFNQSFTFAGAPAVDGSGLLAVETVDRQNRPVRVMWQEVYGKISGLFEDGTSEFTIPDCGHSVDCADRKEVNTDFGRCPVDGPEGEWRCRHVEHGDGGMLIPKFADMQP